MSVTLYATFCLLLISSCKPGIFSAKFFAKYYELISKFLSWVDRIWQVLQHCNNIWVSLRSEHQRRALRCSYFDHLHVENRTLNLLASSVCNWRVSPLENCHVVRLVLQLSCLTDHFLWTFRRRLRSLLVSVLVVFELTFIVVLRVGGWFVGGAEGGQALMSGSSLRAFSTYKEGIRENGVFVLSLLSLNIAFLLSSAFSPFCAPFFHILKTFFVQIYSLHIFVFTLIS